MVTAAQPPHQRVNPVPVTPIQLFEGKLIALAGPLDPFGIFIAWCGPRFRRRHLRFSHDD
jgi:hypothetical protein